MRIAMVAACPLPYPRGTPIRVFRMAEALARRGHELHLVTYHLGEPAEATPVVLHRIPTVRAYRSCAPGPSYGKLLVLDPLLARELYRVLRRGPIDLIHAHHYEGLLVALCARRISGHPVVYDAHTLLESELPTYRIGLPRAVAARGGRFLDHTLPRLAEHVVAVSDTIRRKLVEEAGLAADRVTVAGNGVEREHFCGPHRNVAGARGPGRTVVFAGNLAGYQRIDLLLEAFGLMAARHRDVRLRVVSRSSFGPYEPLATRLGIRNRVDVVDAGFEQLPALLDGADVALNPRTTCDGLPQKLLNYMAAGRAIVSFAGSAATIEHGVTGIVVPDGDVGAFAGAVGRLLDDVVLARTLGANARRRAEEEYSWDRTAARVEAVYEQLLGRRSASPAGASG